MLTRENGKYFSAGLDALLAVVNPFPLMVKVTSISNIIHHIINCHCAKFVIYYKTHNSYEILFACLNCSNPFY